MHRYFFFTQRALFLYIKIIVSLIIFLMLAHFSQLKIELFSAIFYQPFLTFLIVGLFYLTVLINTWRWYRLNSAQSIQLSYRKSVRPTYVSIAFNTILPGSLGGDIIRCYYVLKKFPEKKSRIILSTLIDRVCGLLGIIIICAGVAIYRLDIFNRHSELHFLWLICLSVCGISLLMFAFSMLFPQRIGLSHWLEQKFNHHAWLKPVISVLEALNIYRKSKRVILECLLISIFNQIILLAIILLINSMMNLPMLSLFDYILALSISQIANLIPLTPGGIGIGETAFANILLMLNPGIMAAYATVFFAFRLLMALSYMPGILLGIFSFNLSREKTLLSESVSQ